MGRSKEPTEIDVEVIGKTEKALEVSDGDTKAWIPFSIIDEDSGITEDSEIGESGTLIIPEWKAMDAGFI